jgi:hypothetical protein
MLDDGKIVPIVGRESAFWEHKMETGEFRSGKTRVSGCDFIQSFKKGRSQDECFIPPGQTRFLSNVVNTDNQEGNERRNLANANHTGIRTILVVRVIADDASTSAKEVDLHRDVFLDSELNVATQYRACSHGKLNFTKADDRALTGNSGGGDTGISDGVTTVRVRMSTDAGDDVMTNKITGALNENFGVSSPSKLADHVMYCLPAGTWNGIAYAEVNSWRSVYNNEWCRSVSTQMHEIGHNLNLAHANENDNTYEDQTGMVSDGRILTDSNIYKDLTLTTVLMTKFLLADGLLLYQ